MAKSSITNELFQSDAHLLAELVIEYFSNTNAAGEYDGNDARLLYDNTGEIDSEILKKLAYKVIQFEEMREWNL